LEVSRREIVKGESPPNSIRKKHFRYAVFVSLTMIITVAFPYSISSEEGGSALSAVKINYAVSVHLASSKTHDEVVRV